MKKAYINIVSECNVNTQTWNNHNKQHHGQVSIISHLPNHTANLRCFCCKNIQHGATANSYTASNTQLELNLSVGALKYSGVPWLRAPNKMRCLLAQRSHCYCGFSCNTHFLFINYTLYTQVCTELFQPRARFNIKRVIPKRKS